MSYKFIKTDISPYLFTICFKNVDFQIYRKQKKNRKRPEILGKSLGFHTYMLAQYNLKISERRRYLHICVSNVLSRGFDRNKCRISPIVIKTRVQNGIHACSKIVNFNFNLFRPLNSIQFMNRNMNFRQCYCVADLPHTYYVSAIAWLAFK